ncbi:MAG: helix-turn-helix transcriptional regulator [Patescibacteria group bacterium]|nr:helix-turn-helix transcriptional regulator [Patescibacteria group bacterium]MCL5262132.1 helix-turn-helix transcriptional regulator [Patescibacteria group bacterium]
MKNKIAVFRKEIGLTQEGLAEKAEVTRQTIIALEQNKYNPSLRLAHAIARALKKDLIEEVFILE